MSRWPAMTWAMCGGSPFMIASVMKIPPYLPAPRYPLPVSRKSWGV